MMSADALRVTVANKHCMTATCEAAGVGDMTWNPDMNGNGWDLPLK
jgi:hypothetical protein